MAQQQTMRFGDVGIGQPFKVGGKVLIRIDQESGRELISSDRQAAASYAFTAPETVERFDFTALLALVDQLRHERDALAEAIGNAAIKGGICRPDADLTGPHLLMLCESMANCLAKTPAEHQGEDELLEAPGSAAG